MVKKRLFQGAYDEDDETLNEDELKDETFENETGDENNAGANYGDDSQVKDEPLDDKTFLESNVAKSDVGLMTSKSETKER